MRASMGPRSMIAESQTLADTDEHDARLQWGRDQMIAEMLTSAQASDATDARFNGAAIR